MKNSYLISIFLLISILLGDTLQGQDWANLGRFKEDNETLGLPSPGEKRVVFMGNSITESWSKLSAQFFNEHKYINRGISGQTTPQMLLRFRADVIDLKPYLVVILAGTNDIAGNTGPSTPTMIMDNIISMSELARANSIKVILCSVLPAYDYPWSPGKDPVTNIAALNEMIKHYAKKNNIIYLDYYPVMADDNLALKSELTYDGVHPNEAGYKIMESLVQKAIKKALK